jgi:hypothetical protein
MRLPCVFVGRRRFCDTLSQNPGAMTASEEHAYFTGIYRFSPLVQYHLASVVLVV